jgi:hypothetical protein
MSTRFIRWGLLAATLLIVGVVFTIRASPVAAGEGEMQCDGPCSSQMSCQQLCLQLYPDNLGVGFCHIEQNCCICAHR